MEKYSLGSIKRDSIRRVFACIRKKSLISRLEISKEIGLSLMTVGKIADALADKNIIIQQKGTTGSVGRKASFISLNNDNFALVLDFTEENPSFAIVNIGGEVLYSETCTLNKKDASETAIGAFLEKAKTFVEMNYLLDPCMGVGVIANGECVDVAKQFASVFGKAPDVMVTPVRAKAAEVISGEKSAIYFEVGTTSAGAYTLDGEICDIDGRILGDPADTVCAIGAFLSPDKIVLDGDASVCQKIEQSISEACKSTELVIASQTGTEKANVKYIGCAAMVADEYVNITKRL